MKFSPWSFLQGIIIGCFFVSPLFISQLDFALFLSINSSSQSAEFIQNRLFENPFSQRKKQQDNYFSTYYNFKPIVSEGVVTPTASPPPKKVQLIAKAQAQELLGRGYCLRVPVLMYHHIQPYDVAKEKGQTALTVDTTVFEDQMQYLFSQHYTVITPQELAEALTTKKELPKKSIVITIDDGYSDAYEYAYPILQKYGLKASFAIATGLIGGDDYLTWEELKVLAEDGNMTILNHTWSHYPLGRGSQATILYEIQKAADDLKEHTGHIPSLAVYPYGSFNDQAIATLKKLGIQAALTTVQNSLQCEKEVMTLPRTRIGNLPLSSYGF